MNQIIKNQEITKEETTELKEFLQSKKINIEKCELLSVKREEFDFDCWQTIWLFHYTKKFSKLLIVRREDWIEDEWKYGDFTIQTTNFIRVE